MTKALDEYVNTDFRKIDTILVHIRRSIDDILKFFEYAPWNKDFGWGYEVRQDSRDDIKGLSQANNSMIISSIIKVSGSINKLHSSNSIIKNYKSTSLSANLSNDLSRRLQETKNVLLKSLKNSKNSSIKTTSNTFGENDPFTMGWVGDILFMNEECKINSEFIDILNKKLDHNKDASAILNSFFQPNRKTKNKNRKKLESTIGDTAFTFLKIVRMLESHRENREIGKRIEQLFEVLFVFLESRLHDQLSYSEIPDSRFDPSDLAFALEACLIISGEKIDRTVIERVFKVMRKSQDARAFWPSEKPILMESAGKVLFPVSVETANSLLFSMKMYAIREKDILIIRKHIKMIERYWRWLQSRVAIIRLNRCDVHNATENKVQQAETEREYEVVEVKGWHSEHINDPSVIHPWETSQVLEFLYIYKCVLAEIRAESLLRYSNVEVVLAHSEENEKAWGEQKDQREAILGDFRNLQIYRRIEQDFIDNRKSKHVSNNIHIEKVEPLFSMIIYGPPGTGKTTLVKNLAAGLGYQLISINVSDFLAGGTSEIELRAKNIFQMLEEQVRSVVLFDELDQFLLDRETQMYREQDDVFKFMTPGFLIKFANLREKKNIIFALATNYYERIDPAIKRRGRFDEKYLLLPPDARRRLSFLKNFTGLDDLITNSAQRKLFIDNTRFMTFSEMKVMNARVSSENLCFDDMIAGFQALSPAYTLGGYRSRVQREEAGQGGMRSGVRNLPLEEIWGMSVIQCECSGESNEPELDQMIDIIEKKFGKFLFNYEEAEHFVDVGKDIVGPFDENVIEKVRRKLTCTAQ